MVVIQGLLVACLHVEDGCHQNVHVLHGPQVAQCQLGLRVACNHRVEDGSHQEELVLHHGPGHGRLRDKLLGQLVANDQWSKKIRQGDEQVEEADQVHLHSHPPRVATDLAA